MAHKLAIALSKGRILEQTLPLLAAAGIRPAEDILQTRKLRVDTDDGAVKLLLVRASDVPEYVQHGGADVGVTGKDTLLEHEGSEVYEPVDLAISRCRMVLAGRPGADFTARSHLRVATKYPRLARQFFARRGQQVDIIKLYGSMELAPLVGMADLIVDITDTGSTLKANGLVELAHITDISSRLIINKAAMKIKHQRLHRLIDDIRAAVAERDND